MKKVLPAAVLALAAAAALTAVSCAGGHDHDHEGEHAGHGEEAAAAETAPGGGSKFDFDIADLDDGYRTLEGGGRVPHFYQYCVPKIPAAITGVAANDPKGEVKTADKGLIPCTDDELLVTGHTGQPDFQKVLEKIAAQDFVKKIVLDPNMP